MTNINTSATVYLALGANLGDRVANLSAAINRLGQHVQVEAVSAIYETEPWGVTDQPAFLNQALRGRTQLSPHNLLRFAKAVERDMGREAIVRYGPRLIDIDILLYDKQMFSSYNLTVPHPRLIERAFVLAPLADVAENVVHPGLGCTIADLLARTDRRGIQRL